MWSQEKQMFRLMEVCAEECAQRLDAARDAPSSAVSEAGQDRVADGNQARNCFELPATATVEAGLQ